MSALSSLIESPTRVLFFTGKGGMGKTTLACSTAVALARQGKRVLIVSTDPASNLDEVLGTELSEQPRPVAGITGLDAANIDPEAAAREYRERAVGPYRGLLPDSALASIEESLSGACTVEIAAFDSFAALLGDPQATADLRARDLRHRADRAYAAAAGAARRVDRVHRQQHLRHLVSGAAGGVAGPARALRGECPRALRSAGHDAGAGRPTGAHGAGGGRTDSR